MKIIDFDVGLFNIIPESLKPIPEKYEKAFNNKKIRGTRIYMLKSENMTFNNDIYSLGVILIVLLYKNVKIIINLKKESLDSNLSSNKKVLIKYNNIINQLNKLKEKIEDNKMKLLDVIEKFLIKNDNLNFFDSNNNVDKFIKYKNLIKECIKNKLNINELKIKYKNM